MLDAVQDALYQRALGFLKGRTVEPENYDELAEAVAEGFALAWWCGSEDCEARVKDETKATIRCIPLDQPEGEGQCIVCGKPAAEQAIFARAY